MSKYTTLAVGWNNHRSNTMENPEEKIELSGARPGVLWLPDINSWHAVVLVDGEWFVGRDEFESAEAAMAVAKVRARERERSDG